MRPRLFPAVCDALRTALHRAGYTTDGVRGLIERRARTALGRGEPSLRTGPPRAAASWV